MADTGNKYDDKGRLGSYCTRDSQFPNPEGMKTFTGFGADKSDLERGFCEPTIRALPDYDLANYKERYSRQKQPGDNDNTTGLAGYLGLGVSSQDFEFREKERTSKGFLSRPKLPTDR